MTNDSAFWIEQLQLLPHPEGGAFREVYRSGLKIPKKDLPEGFAGQRSICTSIYFLLRQGEISAFHRIASDEIWHFYAGSTLTVYEIVPETGRLIKHHLGPGCLKAEVFQTTIPAGSWFAAKCEQEYSLVGCTVSPGFDFEDFELGERKKLITAFPVHEHLIVSLTR
jgi:uncharacterized protein